MSLTISVDEPLPSVGLRASDGYLLNLRSFVGKQPAAFLFFGGPTMKGAARRRGLKAVEALVKAHDRLHEAGIAVVGVSCDSEEQQAAYIAEAAIPFLLFSDERRSAAAMLAIDLVSEGANYNVARPLVVAVDSDGLVRAIIDKVEPDTLADELLQALSEPMPAAVTDA